MASLLLKTEGLGGRVLELKLGVNRFGRGADNDFQIPHPTVSTQHCEVLLSGEKIIVRDCDSTNGTYLDDEPVREEVMRPGQILRLGEVELLVETTDVRIAIPTFEAPRPAPPPAVLADGSLRCLRHPQVEIIYRCSHCGELLCDSCVTRLRRRGGALLKLCPLCSHKAERIVPEKRKKRSLFEILNQTIKLPFIRASR